MPLISREIVESRRIEGDLALPRRAYTMFRVWDDEAGATITPFEALSAPGVPQRGDPHPSNGAMLADRFDSHRIIGDTNLVDIEWEYVPEEEFYPGPGPGQDGYLVVGTSHVQREFKDVFRINPSIGSIIDIDANVVPAQTWTDIGGDPIDVAGVPTSYPFVAVTIEIIEHRAGPLDLAVYAAFVNTRNDDDFAGIAPNYGLYLGASSVAIGPNIFALNHTIQVDGFFHLVQVPMRDQHNEVVTVPYPAPQGGWGDRPEQRYAANVNIRQLFTVVAHFQDISPNFGDL